MTKAAFLHQYEVELRARYAWTLNAEKHQRFMDSVCATITTDAKSWNHDGEAVVAAWRAIGGKGKPTLKALRALE